MQHHISSAAHRIVAAALFVAVLGFAWDVWWHVVLIRDTPWEPPHLLVFASVAIALCVTLWARQRTQSVQWRRLLFSILGLPFSALFDQLWHEMFGAEDLSSPLIALSPPHILLGICFLVSGLLLLPLIHHERNARAQELFGSLTFGVLLIVGIFLAIPFHPIFYGFGVLGFAGTGVVAFVFVALVLSAADWRPTFAGGTLAVVVFLLFYNIAFGGARENAIIKLNPHSLPPIWLHTFACLVPAVFLDYVQRAALWVRGSVAGLLYGLLMFGLLWRFLPDAFVYSFSQGLTAVVASTVGGAVAGAFLTAIRPHAAHQVQG